MTSNPGTTVATPTVMKIPIQISFHRMPPSAALEANIRRRAGELERFSRRIVSCHVVVAAPHRRHHQGRLYRVHIELGIPGELLVVGRSPDENGAHEDVRVAVRDSFRAMRRQLEDHVRRQRGKVKAARPAAGLSR